MIARHDDGAVVSANVAPSSSTDSVTSNQLLAAAYAGCQFFPPIEIFEPGTSNSLMTALLVHDITNRASESHPDVALPHPM